MATDDLSENNSKAYYVFIQNGSIVSNCPRIIYLKNNANFGELKRAVFFIARFYINISDKIQDYINSKIQEMTDKKNNIEEDDNEDEKEFFTKLNEEYNDIFENSVKNNLLDNFPYEIAFKEIGKEGKFYTVFNGIQSNFNDDYDIIDSLENNDIYLIFKNSSNINSNSNRFLNIIPSFNLHNKSGVKLEKLLKNMSSQNSGNKQLYSVPEILILRLNKPKCENLAKLYPSKDVVIKTINNKDGAKYDLFGLIIKKKGDEYISIIRKKDQWFEDKKPEIENVEKVETIKNPYMLFYEKNNSI